ncbi:DUF1553 domain-containing protein [soil metagenome]
MKAPAKLILGILGIVIFAMAIIFSLSNSDSGFSEENLTTALPEKVDFNFHIKPLLSDRCFACHGPDPNTREANFRLDIEEGAFAAIDSLGKTHAIVKGNLKKSQLFQRIISNDPDLMMPPPESNLSLSDYEIALLGKWIKQGAEWKQHWSFASPVTPELPEVKNKEWVKSSIDHFILSKIEAAGLKPSPQASKESLIRRVSFDLTGLPPSVDEVDAFLADNSSNAYEKVVDRLLASPHYGERMAADWLDLARYADSHGYQDDGMRNSWPWRDWVIKAYNENLPYDEFVKWQLAGDLLPNPSKEQLIATSFNRNHPQTQEGGVVDEEYRVEYVADRANTVGKAFLGLTVECARCHDHKYDPISQKDYFSLFAFFNNNNESGIIPYNGEASPTLILTSEEAESQLIYLREKISPLEESLKPVNYQQNFKNWLVKAEKNPENFSINKTGHLGNFEFEEAQDQKEFKNSLNKPLKGKVSGDPDKKPLVVPGKFGKGRQFIGDAGIEFTKELNFDRHQPFSISIWVNLLKEGEEGTLFAKSNGEFDGFRGYRVLLNKDRSLSVSLSYVWPANSIDFVTHNKMDLNKWYHLALTYDGSSKSSGVKLFIDGKETERKVLTDNLQKSIMYGENEKNWSPMPFLLARDVRSSIQHIVMDELNAYARQLSSLEVQELSDDQGAITKILKTPEEKRHREDKEKLFEYYLLNFDKQFADHLARITQLREEENKIITVQPEVMIISERSEPLPAYILDRGEYDSPTEEVAPDTPGSLIKYDEALPKNRLGLTEWLLNPQHPLTSRVTVNRLWAMCFGVGLVNTPDDFGNQGALPTHPELLDWLAVNLMKSGWNVKKFMKMIVMSSAYQQSSIPSNELKEKDPDNHLYTRGPGFRLSAEMVRDNALAASGLLAPKIGGPSVYPYQPEGIWEALATRNKTSYTQGKGEDLYRRSLYTVWKRSSPPPSMMNFDASDRYLCQVKRQKTSTPLQALVLMNDPQYIEASRILAERMIKEGGTGTEERINFAFKALTSRAPREEEINLLKDLLKEELNDLKNNPGRADDLLSIGEYERDKKLDPQEVAAYTIVASTIMNFDEFVVKR